jgi:hypothetical protein
MRRFAYGAVLVLLAVAVPLTAQPFEPYEPSISDSIGIGFWAESVSQTRDINGGTYFTAGASAFLGNFALLNIRYMTDIVPLSFDDQILSATLSLRLRTYADLGEGGFDEFGAPVGSGPALLVGPTYMLDFEPEGLSHYVGVAISPLSTWKLGSVMPGLGFYFDFLTVRFLWDVEDFEFLWSYSTFSLSFF